MSSGLLAFGSMAEDVIVDRVSAGDYVDGLWVEGGLITPITIKASVQPMKINEQVILPEGVRDREGIKLYTDTELKTVDEENGISADVVNYQGNKFEVFKVLNYRMKVLDHFKVIALKESN